MTRKTTFIVGLAALTLAFGVQAAQGMSDASDRAQQAAISTYPDVVDRAMLARKNAQPATPSVYPDAFERAAAARGEPTSGALPGHVDRYELDLPQGLVAPPTTGSGSEIEWPQIGIGVGIGIFSAVAMVLAFRFTRSRPLAHG